MVSGPENKGIPYLVTYIMPDSPIFFFFEAERSCLTIVTFRSYISKDEDFPNNKIILTKDKISLILLEMGYNC
ncbi:hypothetical protein AS888_19925 [Peribacillus simplex]|uniref:Uncharacterized protein n=1 Tax=Peribacillus simplex TaxID=1478 RepID=A0A109MXL8_9BACI|nr:hypothetical protein AS888_19925 [Peribacillus simplex]